MFWAKKSRDNRRPRVLLQLLRDLRNKWLKALVYDQEGHTGEIVLEPFLSDLEENTRKWMRRH